MNIFEVLYTHENKNNYIPPTPIPYLNEFQMWPPESHSKPPTYTSEEINNVRKSLLEETKKREMCEKEIQLLRNQIEKLAKEAANSISQLEVG